MIELFSSYTGQDFLLFYGLLLVTALGACLWIPTVMRPEGQDRFSGELEDAAMLTGGSNRHAEAVTTEVLAHGGIEPTMKGKLVVSRHDVEVSDAGRSLLNKVGDFSLNDAKNTLEPYAESSKSRLIANGLLMEQGEAMKLRLYSVLPLLVLLVIGLYRQQAGSALGEPTGYLVMLLIITAVCAAVRFFVFSPLTRAGARVVGRLIKENQRMRSAPTPNEAGFAVAMFGMVVLAGTPFESVHAMRENNGGGGDGGYGGDGDAGGSGCGGGGCGGCGG